MTHIKPPRGNAHITSSKWKFKKCLCVCVYVSACVCVCVGLHATAWPKCKCVCLLPSNKWCMCKWGKVLLLYLVMKNPRRLRRRRLWESAGGSRPCCCCVSLCCVLMSAGITTIDSLTLPPALAARVLLHSFSRSHSRRLRTLSKAYEIQGLANKLRSIKHSSVQVKIRDALSDFVFYGCHDTDMARPTSASGVRCSVRLNLTAGIY